jgi:hypothetical protein
VGGIARSAGISIILVLSVVCLVLTPVVVWGRNLLLNTDRYVQTVDPLASNPGVQNTVIAAVDAQFQGRIDLKSVLDPVLPPRPRPIPRRARARRPRRSSTCWSASYPSWASRASSAPKLALALGYDLDDALEQ